MDSANPPVDAEKLEELIDLFGDREEVKDLFHEFFDELPSRLSTMRSGLEPNTPSQIDQAAHALKGSSASLGATQVQAAALALESDARNEQLGDAPIHFAVLEKELEILQKWLTDSGLL
ncbi:MAG: Hpt domain-containing protein [Planctomycetes bacterium]|nr:Hpt domain-containing protein [Planctomycetota bacterium]